MLQYNPTVSGSLQVTGTITATQGITGSFSGSVAGFPTDVSAFSASLSTRITATESTSSAYVTTSSSLASRVALTEATASQYVTASGSLSTRVTATEATASQFITASGSISTRLTTDGTSIASINAKTGSFATTGSNYFIGNQVITGSVYIANDLIVQGSSSLQNITASAVSIGTNRVILNTATPILQFGGISVYDSGSTMGRSGSLLWNSINDHWINVNPSGSDEGYNSAMVINGPKNTGSLGNEVGLTLNYIPVSQGEDHITNSVMIQSGSNIGIGTTPSPWTSGWTALQVGTTALQNVGAFSQLSNNIYYDGTNYRFITSNGASRIGLNTDGEVFIGTVGSGTAGGVATIVTRLSIAGATGAATFASSVAATQGIFSENSANIILQALKTGATNATTALIRQTGAGGNGNQDIGLVVDIQGANNADRIANFRYYDGTNYNSRVVINRGGNVGIGTISPDARLEIYPGSITSNALQEVLRIDVPGSDIFSSATGYINFRGYDVSNGTQRDIAWIGSELVSNGSASGWFGGNLIFRTTSSGNAQTPIERMRITSGGNVGIGTTAPKLNGNNGTFVTIDGGSSASGWLELTTSSTTNGLGGSITFNNNNIAGADKRNAQIVGARDGANNSGRIEFLTWNAGSAAERMRITSGGAIVQNSVNGRLTKTGSTSVTFTLTIGSIGAWTPGYATIRVSGTRGGLQEHYAAMYFLKLVYFQGSNTATINNLSGDTGSASVSVSTSFDGGNTVMTITISDGGASTDYMIADIDASAFTGIGSIT
jgi:hypothetical protein